MPSTRGRRLLPRVDQNQRPGRTIRPGLAALRQRIPPALIGATRSAPGGDRVGRVARTCCVRFWRIGCRRFLAIGYSQLVRSAWQGRWFIWPSPLAVRLGTRTLERRQRLLQWLMPAWPAPSSPSLLSRVPFLAWRRTLFRHWASSSRSRQPAWFWLSLVSASRYEGWRSRLWHCRLLSSWVACVGVVTGSMRSWGSHRPYAYL